MAETAPIEVPDAGTQRGVIPYFARNPVAANVLLFLLFVGGLIASDLITLETFPEYDPRIIRVEVPRPRLPQRSRKTSSSASRRA